MESVPPPGGTPHPWERPAPPPGTEPEPPEQVELSHRLLQAAGVVAVLLIAVIAYSVVTGDEDASIGSTAVAKAAERTWQLPGARFSIGGYLTYPHLSNPVPLNGRGEFNSRTGRTREAFRGAFPGSNPFQLEAITADGEFYLRSPGRTGTLLAGKRWLGVALHLNSSEEGLTDGAPEAREQLELLQAVSDVDDLGEGTVNGRATEIYRAKIDPDRFEQLLREEGEEDRLHVYEAAKEAENDQATDEELLVWIGGGLVRRMRVQVTVSKPEGDRKLDFQLDFHDFGVEPRIDPPPTEQVVDLTSVAREKLGLLNGATVKLPSPSAGASPLSMAAWRAKTDRICAAVDSVAASSAREARERAKQIGRESEDAETFLRGWQALASNVIAPAAEKELESIRRLARIAPPTTLDAGFDRFLRLSAISLELTAATVAELEMAQLHEYETRLRPKELTVHRDLRQAAAKIHLGLCARDHSGR